MDLETLLSALKHGDTSVLPSAPVKTRRQSKKTDGFKELKQDPTRVYGYSGNPHKPGEPVARKPAWHVVPGAELETRGQKARRKYLPRELEKADYSPRHFAGVYPEIIVV